MSGGASKLDEVTNMYKPTAHSEIDRDRMFSEAGSISVMTPNLGNQHTSGSELTHQEME